MGFAGALNGDFLETSVAYYVRRLSSRTSAVPAPCSADALPEPFQALIDAVAGLVEQNSRSQAEFQQLEDDFVAEALALQSQKLREHAEKTFAALQSSAAAILPALQSGGPLPREELLNLNAALQSASQRYGAPAKAAGAIADNLLNAEPGSKVYPNLLKVVGRLCGFSLEDVWQQETSMCRAQLLQGGASEALDTRRAELDTRRQGRRHEQFARFAGGLSRSDHSAVHQSVRLGDSKALAVSSWNVLEFPQLGAKDPVLHGVMPICGDVLKHIGSRNAQDRQLVLDAMCSEPVVAQHAQMVLSFVRESFEEKASDIVLLQELGRDVRERLSEECQRRGWSHFFSAGSAEPDKCAAITGVISVHPFDETAQVECVRDGKSRPFAAVRQGQMWVVSCHIPLTHSNKGKGSEEDPDIAFGAQMLEQLWKTFGKAGHGGGGEIIAGGDWNGSVSAIQRRASTGMLEGCAALSAHAPTSPTSMSDCLLGRQPDPIDGVFCLS